MPPPPGPDTRTDDQLVAAANRGDERAMEEIYVRHRDWALRLAWRFTRDHDLAMDAVQEAFMYLFRKCGRGPGGGLVLTAKLTTLLYPAIKNSALAARRKMNPRSLAMGAGEQGGHASEFDIPAPSSPPAGSAAGEEQRAELSRLLSTLSDAHREVLLMKVVDGMEHREIALALGIPEGTVKSRLHHALAALRQGAGESAHERFL